MVNECWGRNHNKMASSAIEESLFTTRRERRRYVGTSARKRQPKSVRSWIKTEDAVWTQKNHILPKFIWFGWFVIVVFENFTVKWLHFCITYTFVLQCSMYCRKDMTKKNNFASALSGYTSHYNGKIPENFQKQLASCVHSPVLDWCNFEHRVDEKKDKSLCPGSLFKGKIHTHSLHNRHSL